MTQSSEHEKGMPSLWALPIFDYVESFNSHNSDVQVVCDPASTMQFVHLHFRKAEHINDLLQNILHVSVTHDATYNLSGYFSMRPSSFLPEEISKRRAESIARLFFSKPFGITDEKEESYRYVTPSTRPHLVHRHFPFYDLNKLTESAFYFERQSLSDFGHNSLEPEIRRFLKLLEDID